MKTPINSVEIPDRHLRLAEQWYSGQSDMLYAVASTGGLTLGNRQPLEAVSDEHWYWILWRDLGADIAHARRLAERDGHDDLQGLRDFEAFADGIADRLWSEYGLEALVED